MYDITKCDWTGKWFMDFEDSKENDYTGEEKAMTVGITLHFIDNYGENVDYDAEVTVSGCMIPIREIFICEYSGNMVVINE